MSELLLTLGWVAAATSGRLLAGDPAASIGAVVTDSRAVQPGDFFVALRGPRFDAHSFVGDVLRRGAAGALVQQVPDQGAGAGAIVVSDTLQALQDMARAVRAESGSRVVAITGSAGKTTTKEAVAELLAAKFRVVKNKGNLNNHIGLPLSLMQLRTAPDVAVMELGMNHAGEIRKLVGIAAPDVRVWTNVGDAHLGFFASPDAIADAKAEILDGAGSDTLLVCNADDARVMRRVQEFPGRTLTFGLGEGAMVRAVDVEDRGLDGMRARVLTPAGACDLDTPLLGRGNLANVLAATAVAVEFRIAVQDIVAAVARLRPADRRGAVHSLAHGVTLIDDSYNSSPAALRRALEVLEHDTRGTRKVAVLGEMLELGTHATALHAECGAAAAAAGVQLLIAVGGDPARALADEAVRAGMRPDTVSWFPSSDEAADASARLVRSGDVVLVKGSRGTRTDVVADRLRAELA